MCVGGGFSLFLFFFRFVLASVWCVWFSLLLLLSVVLSVLLFFVLSVCAVLFPHDFLSVAFCSSFDFIRCLRLCECCVVRSGSSEASYIGGYCQIRE